jgi:SAM-dependent methyltransferase
MNAKKLKFPDEYFDVIICIDVFEHLYKDELEIAMQEITRVLKKGGLLFIHVGPNKTLYDFTYKYYTLPINRILTYIDKKIKNTEYDPLPTDPRTQHEKEQHVNEPTFFYLWNLFRKYGFQGEIQTEIGFIKETKGPKTAVYNFLIALYPLSKIFPLNTLFSWAYICLMRKNGSKMR